jgi:hypothetical protein
VVAPKENRMMVLMISTILASLALGVTIAYALCSALFTIFRIHTQGKRPAALQMHTKIAHP